MGSVTRPEIGKAGSGLGVCVCLDEGLLPAPTGTCRVPPKITSAAAQGPEFGSDPASREYLGPVN